MGARREPDTGSGLTMIVGPRAVVPGRIGVFGGTFDPIHHGHLAVAEAAREELGLERVQFVPSRVPPHRPTPPVASAEDRAAMVGLAVATNAAFALSRDELDREGPSYTVDTIEALVARERAVGREPDIWLIVSADAFAGFPTWRRPQRILELCRVAVLPRDGQPGSSVHAAVAAMTAADEDRIKLLDGPQLRVSASQIRERAAAGLSVRYLVPDAVARYIDDHRLYREERVRPSHGHRPTSTGGTITE